MVLQICTQEGIGGRWGLHSAHLDVEAGLGEFGDFLVERAHFLHGEGAAVVAIDNAVAAAHAVIRLVLEMVNLCHLWDEGA